MISFNQNHFESILLISIIGTPILCFKTATTAVFNVATFQIYSWVDITRTPFISHKVHLLYQRKFTETVYQQRPWASRDKENSERQLGSPGGGKAACLCRPTIKSGTEFASFIVNKSV